MSNLTPHPAACPLSSNGTGLEKGTAGLACVAQNCPSASTKGQTTVTDLVLGGRRWLGSEGVVAALQVVAGIL